VLHLVGLSIHLF
jgi:hypothetical protein